MKYLSLLLIAIVSTLHVSAQEETDYFFMAPEGTILTLKKDYTIPADSMLVFLNTKGDEHTSSFTKIHLTVTPSHKWRVLRTGTVLVVKGITRQRGFYRFKMIFNDETIYLHVDGVLDPLKLKINLLDDYFDVKFPPMEEYRTHAATVTADTLILDEIHDSQIDSLILATPPLTNDIEGAPVEEKK